MQPGKKMLQAAWALGLGLALLVPTSGLTMSADDAPESIEISALANFYGPVTFDHAMHTEVAQCSDCHHHTTGTGPASPSCARCHEGTEEGESVSCIDCHSAQPFTREGLKRLEDPEIFHIDRPGLKGAYHLNCVGCHKEMGGPTGCQDCHEMTEAGEKLFNTGKFTPAGYSPGTGAHEAEKEH